MPTILQFPLGDLSSHPDWRNKLKEEKPFGPQDAPPGFSSRLVLTMLPALTGNLVAPFDGFLRRILDAEIPPGEDPPIGPSIFELQPLVKLATLALADGLNGQMPRLRWLNLDPVDLHSDINPGRILSQLTATDANQEAHRVDRFLAGASSIFVERGTVIATGLTAAEIEIFTREGVAVDPVAYYSHYLASPAGPDDLLADRQWLENLLTTLTRRALVQIVDEHGTALNSVTVRRPGILSPEIVDTTASQGILEYARFTAGGAVQLKIGSIEIPEPTPDPTEQTAERYLLTSAWPLGELLPSGPIALDPPDHPVFRRFVVTHLRDWLTSQYITNEALRLPRYTLGNRAEALVDGLATFKRMYEDIIAIPVSGPNRFFYLAGWLLTPEVELIPKDENSRFQKLMQDLVGNGVIVRVMLWDEIQQESDQVRETMILAFIALAAADLVAMELVEPAAWVGTFILSAAFFGIVVPTLPLDLLKNVIENNEEVVNKLNAAGVRAYLDPKVRETRTNGIIPRLYDKIGSHHQKNMVITGEREVERMGEMVVERFTAAYCGGIDVNRNRLDSMGHYARSPYHDVHCRIEGPAATDIVTTFRQRWDDQHPGDLANDGPVVASAPSGATHVIQIARTYPNKLNPANEAYAFAPDGDFSIRSTIKQAIQQAQRYIYIEDQHLTPPDDIRDLLIAQLASHPKLQIVMVIPPSGDMPEGTKRRALFISSLLSLPGVDVNRVAVFFPTKLVFPHDAERHGPIITRLAAEVTESDLQLVVEDPTRFADKGIILIDDEEIRYTSRDLPNRKLVCPTDPFVKGRGFNNTTPAPHAARSVVRQVSYRDIYVHPKLWIIDDVFACIGSANMNERSLSHDSELSAFIIDGFTDRGARSFAKNLRIQLWADHLGLADSTAARLLLDNPDDALDFLLRYPGPAGNHLRRYWRTFNPQLITESWKSLLNPGFYWDMLTSITDDFWDTYIVPSGEHPF